MVLFTLGSVFALYEGVPRDLASEELTSPIVAIADLVVADRWMATSFDRQDVATRRTLVRHLVAVHP